jgi:hypothetical protein
MLVRNRILFAALAVGAVASVVSVIWSSGPGDRWPRLSFELCGYTNDVSKFAIIKVTNPEDRAIIVDAGALDFETEAMASRDESFGTLFRIEPHSSRTMQLLLYNAGYYGSETRRWRLRYYVQRETILRSIKLKLTNLPLIGGHISEAPSYEITSDWFSQ